MSSGKFPVFPLKTLCFPGHKIPLRIFEERYLHMLSDIDDNPLFVVSLISHGEEVGASATPYRVGTLVEFDDIRKQGDFALIQPRGKHRVYLDRFDRDSRPYLTADCTLYADQAQADPGDDRLPELEEKILSLAMSLGSKEMAGVRDLLAGVREELDRENYSLFLCGCLDLPPIYLQRLLESRSLAYRMENALNLLSLRP